MTAAEVREGLARGQVDQQMFASLLRQFEEAERRTPSSTSLHSAVEFVQERVQRPAGGREEIGTQRGGYGIGDLNEPSMMPSDLHHHSLGLPPQHSGGIPMLPLFANPPVPLPAAMHGESPMRVMRRTL